MLSLTLDAALSLWDAGLCVLPAADDGTKRPGVPRWQHYQTARPGRDQLREWFGDGERSGLGVVCGAVSGGLEMLEFEGRAVEAGLLGELVAAASANGLDELWSRVMGGYLERTPSGGIHVLYRVEGGAKPNTKLARRPGPPDPSTGKPTVEVLIETRGEGGWVVTAPSNGKTHPTGGEWELLGGGPASIVTLTADERDALHGLASTLDRMPVPTPAPTPAPSSPAPVAPGEPGELRPGDDFAQRTDWADILEPYGWRLHHAEEGVRYWSRPGKETPGWSATTGKDPAVDRLYVFSAAAHPFEAERPYDKVGAWALLHGHGNDIAGAARALRGLGYGGTRPSLTAPEIPRQTPPPPPVEPAPVPAPEPGEYSLTDDGNALRLVDAIGATVRYVPERADWLVWDTYRWAWDGLGEVTERAREMVRDIATGGDEKLAKHKIRSLSAGALDAAVRLARSDRRVAVSARSLDTAPRALCTPGGVVDLESGTMTAADPSNLHTKATAVAPDWSAPCTRWTRFLDEMFDGDRELIDYVQRLAGYSTSADTGRHVLPFLLGPGGNGKGVLLDALQGVLGDYAASAPQGFLIAGQQQHDTEIARLQGIRLVIASETNPGDRFDEAKVKLLTGGDRLTARFMRQDYFEFEPTHKLWLRANHQPAVGAGGPSFWRRVRLIEAKHIPPKPEDGLAARMVREEGPAILAWAIRGAVEAFGPDGLREPERVMAATKAYRSEEDALGRFVEDTLRLGGVPGMVRIDRTKVYAAHEAWCHAEGERPLSARELYRELRTRYDVTESRSHGRRFLEGVALLETEREES